MIKKTISLSIVFTLFLQTVCPLGQAEVINKKDPHILSDREMSLIKGGNTARPQGCGGGNGSSTAKPKPDCGCCDTKNDKDSSTGGCPTDPVLLTGGKFYLPVVDVEIPGPGRESGLTLNFNRLYSSQDGFKGVLGVGWVSMLDMALYPSSTPGGSVIAVRNQDGTLLFLRQMAAGVYQDGQYKVIKTPTEYQYSYPHGTIYHFDLTGKPTFISDRNGNKITFGYTSNKITSMTDDLGRKLTFTYNATGKLFQMTDPLNRKWTYAYDAIDNLISVTDPLSRVIAYKYADPIDPHNMTEVVDAKGFSTKYTYNAQDQVTQQQKPDGGIVKFTFNPLMGTSAMTDENGGVWNYEYALIGLTTMVKDPANGVWHYTYDPFTNKMSSHTDPLNHKTKMIYDSNQNLIKETDALGNSEEFTFDPKFNLWLTKKEKDDGVTTRILDTKGNIKNIEDPLKFKTSFTYNANGMVTSRTDRNGKLTAFTYDSYGNISSITDPLDNITNFTYDILGRKTSVTDANGHKTQFTYDDGGRLIKKTLADTTFTTFTYDKNDNLISVTDPLGHINQFTYDTMNRRTSSTDTLGNTTTMTYDKRGNILSVTNAMGRKTTFAYDKLDRRITMTDASTIVPAGVTKFTYDLAGRLTRITDAKNQVTAYEYDELDRVIKQIYPDNSTETFTYDPNGNVTSRKTRAGTLIKFSYDANDRLTNKDCPGCGAGFNYDKEGNLTKVTDAVNGTFTYTYDALDRLLSAQQPIGQIVKYEYDKIGLRTKLIYPDNTFLNYSYDALNRLINIKENSGEEYKLAYDAASRRTTLTYPNGIQTKYTFDDADRLTKILTNRLSNNELISQYKYTIDQLGNRSQLVITYPGKTIYNLYIYDELDRLTDVINKPSLIQHYNYDAVGNRKSVFENGVTTNYTANVLNQYTQVNGVPFTYDANGNLTNDGTIAMTYDAENRLTKTVKGATTVNYQYDWSNRLMKKTVNSSAPTHFIYDGWQVIGEAASSRGLTRRYIVGDSIDFLLSQVQGRDKYYFTRDGINSTRDVLDRVGNVIQRMDYDVFGKVTVQDKNGNPSADAPKTNYLFTAREYQFDNGLYNYRNRFYSANLGRFLQFDPIAFKGGDINFYSYVKNNTIINFDPFGLDIWGNIISGANIVSRFLRGLTGAPPRGAATTGANAATDAALKAAKAGPGLTAIAICAEKKIALLRCLEEQANCPEKDCSNEEDEFNKCQEQLQRVEPIL